MIVQGGGIRCIHAGGSIPRGAHAHPAKKQAKRAAPAPSAALSRENVINLMEALRRSMAAEDLPRLKSRRHSEAPHRPCPMRARKLTFSSPVKIARWSRLSFISQFSIEKDMSK